MSLKNVARETLELVETGKYRNSAGDEIDFSREQKRAVAETRLYTPEQLASLKLAPRKGRNCSRGRRHHPESRPRNVRFTR